MLFIALKFQNAKVLIIFELTDFIQRMTAMTDKSRVPHVRKLKHTVNKVSSLRDLAGYVIDNIQSPSVYFVRSLILKIPAMTDKSRRDDTLLTVYFSIRIQ
jgi:hypothetical protein